jgi:hypothetical protein
MHPRKKDLITLVPDQKPRKLLHSLALECGMFKKCTPCCNKTVTIP